MNVLELPNRCDDALRELVDALLAIRPIADASGDELRVRFDEHAAQALEAFAGQCGAANLRAVTDLVSPTVGEELASRRIAVVRDGVAALQWSPALRQRAIVGEALSSRLQLQMITSGDGKPLRVFAGGRPASTGVIIVGACGMPAELLTRWLSVISTEHFVATWETRAMFPPFGDFDEGAADVAVQAQDLIAVMDALGMRQVQVVGLCGGAVIALEAAAAYSEHISAVSVWHGDFFGSRAAKTAHQQDVYDLLTMASRSREDADAIQHLLRNSASVRRVREDIAPLVLYPYLSPELLYRYAVINGAIMSCDLRARLTQVPQLVDVVTSDDDCTAHPDGSRDVAARLSRSRLTLIPHGDHLSLFDAPQHLVSVMRNLLEEHAA